jgi:hypothetical protein
MHVLRTRNRLRPRLGGSNLLTICAVQWVPYGTPSTNKQVAIYLRERDPSLLLPS